MVWPAESPTPLLVRGGGEQDPGQLDPAALPAGQRAHRLRQHPVRKAEVGADPGGLGFGGVAAEGGEPFLDPAVPGGGGLQRSPCR